MIKKLSLPINKDKDKRLKQAEHRLQKVLEELRKMDISYDVSGQINDWITKINEFDGTPKVLSKYLNENTDRILSLVKDELGIVPKNHYQMYWMTLGMSVFGLPLGAAMFLALDNVAFIGIGIPIGLAIGIFVGTKKDQKAKLENRQIDMEE